MHRYDKQIEIIQAGQTQAGLRLRYGCKHGCVKAARSVTSRGFPPFSGSSPQASS